MTERTDTSAEDRAAQRESLLAQHKAARAKRDAAKLDSSEFRAAVEEIARIEVQINGLGEPESPGSA